MLLHVRRVLLLPLLLLIGLAQLDSSVRSQRLKRQSKPSKPALKITDYHVRCSVVSRYAVTTVQSSVWNQLPVIKEAAFEVDLPSSAFISNFTITSGGKLYVAQVTERAAARKIYDAAKKQGKTAGLVATKEREIEKFRVAVSVPPGARVSFLLTYEELLPRRLGRYELSLGLRPGQPVANLTLDVSVTERTGISFLKVFPLKTSRLLTSAAHGDADAPPSTRVERSATCARVRYSPSLQQQSAASSKGVHGDFIVQYDVDLRDPAGDVQVYDGYFVHYFAPRGLPVVPKDVIFVIDVSGSMIGTKIKQTKQAMSTILGDLREGDHFNIITFSDKVHTWRKGRTVRATRQNVRDAKEFVRRIIAEGWTNINAALLSAAQLVNPPSSGRLPSHRVPLVIFLTDGEATIGVTSGDTILTNAKKSLGAASLFGLAFGDDADFLLLKRLALDNRGVARMVYEDADAALQLKGFYDEVASPLLSDVQLSYLGERAFDVTRSIFPNYFQGSELVVAGRLKPGAADLKVSVAATDSKQRLKLENDVAASAAKGNASAEAAPCWRDLDGASDFVRRLWAYFTIKELLLAKLNASDAATQRLLADKATNLSLQYNFVTPVTSLVVVKPDADEPAPTPTTAKPTAIATTTTTTTTTSASPVMAARASAGRRTSSPASARPPGRTKPAPPQPPPNKPQPKKPSPPPPPSPKTGLTTTKRPTTTSSPASARTAPAPLSAKKHAPSQNSSKTPSLPPVGRIATSLLNALKTASPPAPGRVATVSPAPGRVSTSSPAPGRVFTSSPAPGRVFTSSPPPLTTSTSPPLAPLRTDPAPVPGKPLTQQPSTVKTPPTPAVGATTPTRTAENATAPAATPALPSTFAPPTPAAAPAVEDNNTLPEADAQLSIATLLSATFAPMPGVTDGPRLWEAAGLLDVSTSIQIQRKDIDLVKDYDATYDYDYDLNYDSWDDTADAGSFEPSSRLSTIRVFSSSVDGDPHFVVQLPKLQQNLCFTVDGRAGDVLRLLEDPDRGIIVDGRLVGAPSRHGVEDRSRTYFDQLTVSASTGSSGDITVTLSLDGVLVEGEARETLPADQQGSVTRQGVTVTVDNHRSCWLELGKGLRFLVLFHHYKHPSYLQMAHLGFYVTDGRGLSASTQGLLGQFQHADMSVTALPDRPDRGAHRGGKEEVVARGVLRWGAQHMAVSLQDKTLKDSVRKRHLGRCWVVPKAEVQRLLGHPYLSYVVRRA